MLLSVIHTVRVDHAHAILALLTVVSIMVRGGLVGSVGHYIVILFRDDTLQLVTFWIAASCWWAYATIATRTDNKRGPVDNKSDNNMRANFYKVFNWPISTSTSKSSTSVTRNLWLLNFGQKDQYFEQNNFPKFLYFSLILTILSKLAASIVKKRSC